VVPVEIGVAEMTDVASFFEAGGIVRARATAVIASRVLAPVAIVHVRPGDRVRRGAKLVTLDARELRANTARASAALTGAVEAARAAETDTRAAEAALGLARVSHERIESLFRTRSATPQELDQAIASLAAAEAQLAAAKRRTAAAEAGCDAARAAVAAADIGVSYAVLDAPFDGVVSERSVDAGSMAAPGAALLTLEDAARFRLDVQLDEARARQVRVAQSVDVSVSPGEHWVGARVAEVARIDPTSHGFVVKIDLPRDPAFRSGLFGRARFAGPARRTLVVPASAVVRRGQLALIFVVDHDNTARLRAVSLAPLQDAHSEVLSGVRAGDRIVLSPPDAFTDGATVSAQAKPPLTSAPPLGSAR
jgi:RND family efflux transporter MFP subunit